MNCDTMVIRAVTAIIVTAILESITNKSCGLTH